MNFEKFQQNYIIRIIGAEKEVYETSYKDGEGNYLYSNIPNFLDETFTILKKDMSTKKINELFLNHIKGELGCKDLKESWLNITENNEIFLCINEVEDYYQGSIYCENLKRAEAEKKKVFNSMYRLKLFINNIKVTSEDLESIFKESSIL